MANIIDGINKICQILKFNVVIVKFDIQIMTLYFGLLDRAKYACFKNGLLENRNLVKTQALEINLL